MSQEGAEEAENFGSVAERLEPEESRLESDDEVGFGDDEDEEEDPGTAKLQRVLQAFEAKFGDIGEVQPRVGGFLQVGKGVTEAWVGGSNIRPIKRPVDLLCRRPTDFRSANVVKVACERGLLGNKKLLQCSDEEETITLVDWTRFMDIWADRARQRLQGAGQGLDKGNQPCS